VDAGKKFLREDIFFAKTCCINGAISYNYGQVTPDLR
jgi:hypothetical protein